MNFHPHKPHKQLAMVRKRTLQLHNKKPGIAGLPLFCTLAKTQANLLKLEPGNYSHPNFSESAGHRATLGIGIKSATYADVFA
jgi:hypothetical protein